MPRSVLRSQPPYYGRIPSDASCYRCGSTRSLHRHHIFAGSLRNISEREGLWVYLCEECHEGAHGIHSKRRMGGYRFTDDEHLRWHAQQAWELQNVRKGFTRECARAMWRSIAKSGMPSYECVEEDRHGQWLNDWK